MDINVTQFVSEACPRDFSASVAEIGNSAGADTWRAAMDEAQDTVMLSTPEELQAMRDFALASGGWDETEVSAWDTKELNALFIQWVSGDLRELGIDAGTPWDDARMLQEEGRAPANLYRADDGQIFFYLGQ